MPLKRCTTDNKSGYKWGNEGKCYTGPEGKKKAIKQGLVIEGPEKFSQKALEVDIRLTKSGMKLNRTYILIKQDIKTVTDWMYNEGYDYGRYCSNGLFHFDVPVTADQIAGYPP